MFCDFQETRAGAWAQGSCPKGRISVSELAIQAKGIVLLAMLFSGKTETGQVVICLISSQSFLGAIYLSCCSFVYYFSPPLSLELCYKA